MYYYRMLRIIVDDITPTTIYFLWFQRKKRMKEREIKMWERLNVACTSLFCAWITGCVLRAAALECKIFLPCCKYLPPRYLSILRNYLHTRERSYERIQHHADELPSLLHWALESERRYDLLFPLSTATATFDRVDRLSSLAWSRISVARTSCKVAKEWAIPGGNR